MEQPAEVLAQCVFQAGFVNLSRACPGSRFWEEGAGSDDEDLWSELRDFWSDDEDAGEAGKRRRAARTGQRAPRASGAAKPRHHIVTHYNTVTQARNRCHPDYAQTKGQRIWRSAS